jgi:integrase
MAAIEESQFPLDEEFPELELEEKLVQSSPEFVPLRGKVRFRFALSQRQRQELIAVAGSYSDTHELMISTQLLTGIRVGEIVNLELPDLYLDDPANAEMWIQPKIEKDENGNIRMRWHPKTAAGSRRIPLTDVLAKKLKRYIGKYRRKKGCVFISNKKRRFREDTVIHFIDKYAKECKTIGHDIGSHALRRTYASFLINEGVPIGMISKELGHASIEITMRYLFAIESPDQDSIIKNALKRMV